MGLNRLSAFIVTAAACLTFVVGGSAKADWETAYQTSSHVHGLHSDADHERLFVGTSHGFIYRDLATGVCHAVEDTEQIARTRVIVTDPVDSSRLILGRSDSDWNGYIEISEDLGETGSLASVPAAIDGIRDIDRDPSQPTRLFASAYSLDPPASHVLRSEDDGWTWTSIREVPDFQSWELAVDGDGVVYVGGEDGLYRSQDHGDTWGDDSIAPPTSWILCLSTDRVGAENRILAGGYGGLWVSLDDAATWTLLCPYGDRTFQVATHDSYPNIIAAGIKWGATALVVVSYSGGASWENPGYFEDDWDAFQVMTLSPVDHRVYANNFSYVMAHELFPTVVSPAPVEAQVEITCHPNPFNPSTELRFTLPDPAEVTLRILDTSGREVRHLLDDVHRSAGEVQLAWDGLDNSGQPLPSGVYFCEVEAGEYRATRKMTLLK